MLSPCSLTRCFGIIVHKGIQQVQEMNPGTGAQLCSPYPVNEIYPLDAVRIETFNSTGFLFVYKRVIVVRTAFLAVSEQAFFSYFIVKY